MLYTLRFLFENNNNYIVNPIFNINSDESYFIVINKCIRDFMDGSIIYPNNDYFIHKTQNEVNKKGFLVFVNNKLFYITHVYNWTLENNTLVYDPVTRKGVIWEYCGDEYDFGEWCHELFLLNLKRIMSSYNYCCNYDCDKHSCVYFQSTFLFENDETEYYYHNTLNDIELENVKKFIPIEYFQNEPQIEQDINDKMVKLKFKDIIEEINEKK